MKTDHKPTDQGPGLQAIPPGQQGSPVSLAILLMLNSFKGLGLTSAALQAFTEHPPEAVRAALMGLKNRGRVTCTGLGRTATWHVVPHKS